MVDKSIFMATQNWIKTYVIQILPVLALIVYIIGFVYYMVYYYQFGINITSYITLAEVLVSTLTPILIVVMLSVAFISFIFVFLSFCSSFDACIIVNIRHKSNRHNIQNIRHKT